ncbi:DUF378 domain-containing protein [Candidatus Gracilibacteria bacterium]|nr:DUF378 domain-containing protein [Candidatus Gracilibacteria bacterium]
MKAFDSIALLLLVIGGINWGLIGAFDFNLVNTILGGVPVLETIVYILVGIAALFVLFYDGKRLLDFSDNNNNTVRSRV